MKCSYLAIDHCFGLIGDLTFDLIRMQASITKDEVCKLVNNAQRNKWKIQTSAGVECQVPSVCLLIPPPDAEAIDAADRLKRQYDRCEALWLKKQMRMSQNMIFATIKVSIFDPARLCCMIRVVSHSTG